MPLFHPNQFAPDQDYIDANVKVECERRARGCFLVADASLAHLLSGFALPSDFPGLEGVWESDAPMDSDSGFETGSRLKYGRISHAWRVQYPGNAKYFTGELEFSIARLRVAFRCFAKN